MLSIGTASILSLWPLITTSLRHHALSRSSRQYVSISLFVTASTTALCTPLLPQLCRSYDLNATAYIISLWSLSLQHILCHYASIVTASSTSIRSLAWHKIYVTMPPLLQPIQRYYNLYWYSIYNVTLISIGPAVLTPLWHYCHSIYHVIIHSIVTAAMTSLWSSCYSIYNILMIPIATAYIMSLCLDYYSIYSVFMISLITTYKTPQWSSLLQNSYVAILLNTIGHTALITMLSNEQPFIPDYGPRLTLLKLPREPTGCASPGAAGGMHCPRPCPRLCHFMLSYCVLCFAICVIRYPRTKTYKPRGRASDVSTISTCFSFCHDLLPTPPPISVRTAGGITVVYLCGF
jgi:hypothetical protein